MINREPRRFRGLDRELLHNDLEVPVASTLRSRLLGLAFLDRDSAPAGLLFPRCRSIHTFAMRFALDLVFFDAAGRPIHVVESLAPGRFVSCRRAGSVLELKGGAFRLAGVDGATITATTEPEGATDARSERPTWNAGGLRGRRRVP